MNDLGNNKVSPVEVGSSLLQVKYQYKCNSYIHGAAETEQRHHFASVSAEICNARHLEDMRGQEDLYGKCGDARSGEHSSQDPVAFAEQPYSVEKESLAHKCRDADEDEVQVEFLCRYEQRWPVSPVGDETMVAGLADEDKVCDVEQPYDSNEDFDSTQVVGEALVVYICLQGKNSLKEGRK